jgi:arylsulfatase A-like enzyme
MQKNGQLLCNSLYVRAGLFHVSDWLPTALELAGVAEPKSAFPELDGFPMWCDRR